MADKNGPDETGKPGPGKQDKPEVRDNDLERRRRRLEASLATRRPEGQKAEQGGKSGSLAGYGQALKLSSEFIAGIAVGAGLGWMIDRWAGTSPWGLIVFLLLGFGAGVLNVLRSAGVVAQPDLRTSERRSDGSEEDR
ncbi:AtpZ/AtpI family protein [Pseudaminobacter sp. NGMCC 1.201702]|uniref:AtpZ/AtpI family protein n=1 Tax=Pseudaminobacter sp. NGMCC 1.201702 TaxID=3391825 RepID=UPI0039F079DC